MCYKWLIVWQGRWGNRILPGGDMYNMHTAKWKYLEVVNIMNYVYHSSPIGQLNIIKPNISTHGESYVYATKDKALNMIFLQRWNNFTFNVAYGDDKKLEITERYKGALEEIFKGKSGYIYKLNGEQFIQSQTRFEGELVSQFEAKVLEVKKIDDILSSLLKLEKDNIIRIRKYPDRHLDIPMDDSDLVEEAIYFYKKGQRDIIDYCIKKHPHLKDKFKNVDLNGC